MRCCLGRHLRQKAVGVSVFDYNRACGRVGGSLVFCTVLLAWIKDWSVHCDCAHVSKESFVSIRKRYRFFGKSVSKSATKRATRAPAHAPRDVVKPMHLGVGACLGFTIILAAGCSTWKSRSGYAALCAINRKALICRNRVRNRCHRCHELRPFAFWQRGKHRLHCHQFLAFKARECFGAIPCQG